MPANSLIYVLDDDNQIVEAIEGLLRSVGYRVHAFVSAEEFFAFPKPPIPSCLILDLNLGQWTGLEVQEKLTKDWLLPVIFLTGHGDIHTAIQALKNGANEFLCKPIDGQALLLAVNKAVHEARKNWANHEIQRTAEQRYSKLTPREREIFSFIVRGFLNKQTAYELGISEITIRIHRVQIMRKMGADSLADLVRSAVRLDVP